MSELSHSLVQTLATDWPVEDWAELNVVVALSGGADSVALLRGLLEIKSQAKGAGQLSVAHFNHRLRGEASDHDEAWVQSLCAELKLPLEVGAAEVGGIAGEGGSIEAAARQQRYRFLLSTAERLGARFVATAHHLDDQAETILHHIVRGTGLTGLAGMPEVRSLSRCVALVRPLLGVRRGEIVDYLKSIEQSFVCDETNIDTSFTRNRLRQVLVPLLRSEFNENVDEALIQLAFQAGEAQQLIESLASKRFAESVQIDRNMQSIVIQAAPLADEPAIVCRELCKLAWKEIGWPMQAMGFAEWQQLHALLGDAANRQVINLPGNVRADRCGRALILTGSTQAL